MPVPLKTLKQGDLFTLKEVASPTEHQVMVRDHYDRSTKTYCCHYFDDVCHERFFKGTKEVFTNFYF